MAYATKTRGFRRITVAGVPCRWGVRMGEDDTVITLQSARVKSCQQVFVTLPGYSNSWLALPWERAARSIKFVVITPALVRRVIERACSLGWQPEMPAAPLAFTFHPELDHAA